VGASDAFCSEPIRLEYAQRQGQVTPETQAKIKEFVQQGGTVIAIGNAAGGAATLFGLPVTNHFDQPREKYYVPGAVLRVSLDTANPVPHGLGKELDVFFD